MVNTMFVSFQNCMLNSRLLSVKVLEGSSLGDNYKFYFYCYGQVCFIYGDVIMYGIVL